MVKLRKIDCTTDSSTGGEDIKLSKNQWKKLKKPFLAIGSDKIVKKLNNDELLRTDTLNTDTEEDSVVIYKNDKNGNQLATVNRYEIPSDKKDSTYVDIDVTLGDNRLNENVVNHYDALNQLTQTLTKNYKFSFTYDAEGLRTSKTVNGEKTVFVWDGDQLVLELSESGKVKKRYVRGNDLMFADKGDSNTSGEASEKQYYVTDSHGNVVQLTNESGKVIKTYEYDSFGNEVKPDSKDENPFRYCGEYYDKETEEVYLRARYYEPAVGRFLTRDTYTGEEDEPESLHLYVYCENDGVNMIDPSGHWGKYHGAYVHQNLVEEALNSIYKSGNYVTSTELHLHWELPKKQLKVLLHGAILPDYVTSAKKAIHPFEYSYKKSYRTAIRKLKIEKNGNAFHGKSSSSLKKFKRTVNRELKKSRNKEVNAVMIGCALHSIQDYSHSYASDLVDYKKNRKKYLSNENKYQKLNAYHSDWKKGKRNINKHKEYKDNPEEDFQYNVAKRKWEWKTKDSPNNNLRYFFAKNDTIKYLQNSMKYIR